MPVMLVRTCLRKKQTYNQNINIYINFIGPPYTSLAPPFKNFYLYSEVIKMTHHPWMTNDQKEWLESHKSNYLAANINKTASKDFFLAIFKEFREKWPVPPVSQDEIDDAKGSMELATKVKRDKYDKVRASCNEKITW